MAVAVFAAPALAQTRPAAPQSGGAPATRPSAPPADELWADGSAGQFWIARTPPGAGGKPGDQTELYVRAHGDPAWQRALPQPLGVRIVALVHRGPQPVVVLEGGQWMLLTEAGASTGQPLPRAARLLALGGGAEALWAVGLLPPAPPRATTRSFTTAPARDAASPPPAPTSTRPGATTGPATAPTLPDIPPGPAPKLVLYALKPNGWAALATLPSEVKPADEPERFSVVADEGSRLVYLAHRDEGEIVRVYQLGLDDLQWQPRAQIDAGTVSSRLRGFKILDLSGASPPGPPVLWLAGDGGEERLYFLRPDGPAALTPPPAPGAAARAAAFANGKVRLLRVVDGKLYEQSIDPRPDAKPDEAKPVQLPSGVSGGVVFTQWFNAAMTLALGFAIVAAFLRRREIQQTTAEADRLRLAPVGRRFVAGLIDALPLFLAAGAIYYRLARAQASGQPASENVNLYIGLAGAAAYLLFAMAGELLAGRSLGKWLLGLRVVGLDGKRASPAAVVVRNVLRVIDLGMFFLPLVLVTYSPLRQRPGDVAAGTLVVTDRTDADGSSGAAGENAEGDGPPR